MPLDPKQLPNDPETLRKMLVDLAAQLDREAAEKLKIEAMVRELLEARQRRSSERLSKDQLALFESLWRTHQQQAAPAAEPQPGPDDDDDDDWSGSPTAEAGGASAKPAVRRRGGRGPLPEHLERRRIEYDLPEAEKHCAECGQDLRSIGDETSEHYEYVPASVTVIVSVCKKYACQCTVRTAGKPALPIEKSTAGASVLA